MKFTKKVCIVIKWISHYRVPFYNELRKKLEENGVDLIVLYGEPVLESDRVKRDWSDIPWGIKIQNISIGSSKKGLIWQPVMNEIKDADLVIFEQANKLLLNYVLQCMNMFSSYKIAYWGHGKNFQNKKKFSIGEYFKSLSLRYVDWWFAYNALSAEVVKNSGFSPHKITNVENAIDVSEIKNISNSISECDIAEFREKYSLIGNVVGVFCGGMYREKRLSFLIEAAIKIRDLVPDFELILIGNGSEQKIVIEAASKYAWIHYLGSLYGKNKILAMKSAHMYMMPGLVGLGVLDAFALRLPVITTDYEFHSPEVSYVEHEINGLIIQNDLHEYVACIVDLINNNNSLEKLREGCDRVANYYTIENMASNFTKGVLECLNAK